MIEINAWKEVHRAGGLWVLLHHSEQEGMLKVEETVLTL